MSNRLLMPVIVLSFVAGCEKSPAPTPEKALPDRVVPNYQAATPASSAVNADSAVGTSATHGATGSTPAASADATRGALTAPESEKLSDPQIARITNDANASEIEQGKLAGSRAKDARVKAFAQRMVKHHTDAKDKQTKLKLEPAESALATKLERDAGTTLGDLRANSGTSFDQEYMQAQVKEHQRVLETIDQQLLPNAKSDELKAYLKEIRTTVESHLKDARELESKLTQQAVAPH